MRLRTQLVLASFLLAILPLTAIVIYSYESSRQALESAYRHEAARLTRQMDTRLTSIRGELDTRLADVSVLPLQNLTESRSADALAMAMGDIAPLVNSVEYRPEREPTRPNPNPVPPAPRTAPSAIAAPAIATPAIAPPAIAASASSPRVEVAVAPPAPPEPIIVDLPSTPIPHFALPPDYHQRVTEIRNLSIDLGRNVATMTQEERDKKTAEIQQKNEQLQRDLNANREQFQKEFAVAMAAREKAREERRRAREAQNESVVRQQEQQRETLQRQQEQQREEEQRRQEQQQVAQEASTERVAEEAVKKTIVIKHQLTDEEKQMVRDRARQVSLLLGHDFAVPVENGGRIVGHVAAQVSPDEVIRRLLGTATDEGEIAFAVDREGHLYTRNDKEREALTRIGVPKRLNGIPNWIVVMKNAGGNGLQVGVARRVGEDLEELRRTAGHNFAYGLGLVLVALIGIVPVANHMTRDVAAIAQGAERVAQGDLQTRVPVRSKNEFGQLALAFNKMARDLSEHQHSLVQQKILAADYERTTNELEDARRFQLSMLPKEVPLLDRFEVAVFTQTATEVGGDYYDFHVALDDALTVAIGDATGHGAKAGTMVTVIKTLFSGYNSDTPPAAFLSSAAEKIKRMDLGRMAMALTIARIEAKQVTVASAGMPPVLIHRAATGLVEEIALEATPLGTLGTDYKERSVPVAPRDTILFMSDGLPELTNAAGQQLGYVAAAEAFASAAQETSAQRVIDRLVESARQWHGDQPPNDDMTFVAVRVI
jgi:serine phosphatase RsbU (regulator of sigma subunit)